METPARPAFNKRTVTKYVASHLVSATVAIAVTRVLKNNFPQTETLRIAELTGGVAGWYAATKMQPVTDKLVDDGFDALAERKRKNSIQTP
jgi:hypothetical protein